jgi:5'(3')-deoxyribonucleotidase
MKIAIDIDSTLHHYWDLLSAAAQRRFGVDLPYEEQFDWGITRLKPRQLEVCIAETHSDEVIAAGRPYDGAVEAVQRWHEAGHFIHVTSHRDVASHEATARWLDDIGLPYDELYCSDDKVSHCTAIGIDILIDDSPENLERALDAGMVAATILHPWNRELCETEDVVHGETWEELTRNLESVLR